MDIPCVPSRLIAFIDQEVSSSWRKCQYEMTEFAIYHETCSNMECVVVFAENCCHI